MEYFYWFLVALNIFFAFGELVTLVAGASQSGRLRPEQKAFCLLNVAAYAAAVFWWFHFDVWWPLIAAPVIVGVLKDLVRQMAGGSAAN
ncbi:MAG: hypothetical protein ACYTFO_01060 [Planctomycetota bacterium]|jgi:hypothetical protein